MIRIVFVMFFTTLIYSPVLFASVDCYTAVSINNPEHKDKKNTPIDVLKSDIERILRINNSNDPVTISDRSVSLFVRRIESFQRDELIPLLPLLEDLRQLNFSKSIVSQIDAVISEVLALRESELNRAFEAILVKLVLKHTASTPEQGELNSAKLALHQIAGRRQSYVDELNRENQQSKWNFDRRGKIISRSSKVNMELREAQFVSDSLLAIGNWQ